MNKAELIDAVAQHTGQTKVATEETLNALIETITENVAAGNAVQLVGFGTFKSTLRAAREGRNPQTGVAIKIPEANVPKFTPGETFKVKVAKAGEKSKAPAKGKKK